ncbi:hypothetical protein SUGI_0806460 [Cryptomeria japonica]|nr:hypothetical protein SUGI_0806460 [Cryptomeria japonica]
MRSLHEMQAPPFHISFPLWIVFIGGSLDLYFARPSPSDVVQQFTDRIAHTAATPYWASGTEGSS